MIKLYKLTITPFQQNCRLLVNEEGDLAIFDPGGDFKILKSLIDTLNIKSFKIFATHSHIDHIGAVADLIEFGVSKFGSEPEFYSSPGESELRKLVKMQCEYFGLPSEQYKNCPEPSSYLVGGESISILNQTVDVLSVPGHSPDHLAFLFKNVSESVIIHDNSYVEEHSISLHSDFIISGDVIFKDSIGRTDLPGGNHEVLMRSIESKILTLADEVIICPGHGPDTNIGREKKFNPFIR